MKRFFVLLFLCVAVFATTGAYAQQLADLWRNSQDDCFEAVEFKANMGIGDFAAAYARAHEEYAIAYDIGQALKGNSRPDFIFVLDKPHGYLSLSYGESNFIREGEMCYWNLPDGTQRFCVKFKDVNEEEDPVIFLAFYEYDDEAGTFYYTDVEGRAEMLDNLDMWEGNENIFLPRYGKDIKWGRNNSDEAIGWYRYKGLDGFKLERKY